MQGSLSHYDVLEKLGEGGMGAVYKAFDRKLERFVALKFLPASLSESAGDRARLAREAKAASALNHPNILTIHDLEEADGRLFIVMEHAEGRDLRAALAAGPLALHEAVAIATQMADGLAAAEAKGIAHRDIKPANVLLTADGRAKIADFGLAGFAATAPDETITTGGTPRYMSPEQIEGAAGDTLGDVFSFGAVLYEMLAGHAAFDRDTVAATLHAILRLDPPPLAAVRPEVPEALAALASRCLRKRREERPASFRDVLQALRRIDRGDTAPLAEPKAPARSGGTLPARGEAFAGRARELSLFHAACASASAGRGGTILVSGGAGIGKTRLVGEAAAAAEREGLAVYWGRCLHREGGTPYHPFAAALRTALEPPHAETLEAIVRSAERRGIPLAGRRPVLQAFLDMSAAPLDLANKEQLWDAVFLLLKSLAAERPAFLVLDDLHWADRASLGLFAYVARNASSFGLVLVGLHRPAIEPREGSSAQLFDMARQLRIEGAAQTVALDRLAEEEEVDAIRRLFDGRAVDPSLERIVRDAARGHPLFLVELVKLLKEEGRARLDGDTWRPAAGVEALPVPGRVQDVIAQRLERVRKEDREILELASCEGEYFHSDALSACLGEERLALLRDLQRLESDHRLIRHDGARYRFDHPLIRQVLYDGIIPELRTEYHRLIAAHLIAHGAQEEESAARVAHHLLSSGQESVALEHLIRAGEHAREFFAMEEALAHFTRAAEIAERAARPGDEDAAAMASRRVEEGLGDVHAALGRPADAAVRYQRLLDSARRTGDRAKETAALRKLAEAERIVGNAPRAEALAREAIALGADQPREQGYAYVSLGVLYTGRGEYGQALDALRSAEAIARAASDRRLRAASLSQIGLTNLHRGEMREANSPLLEALAIAREEGDPVGLAVTLNHLGGIRFREGRMEEALAMIDECLRLKRSIGDQRGIPGALNIVGDIRRDLLDPEGAIEYHERSLAVAREQQNRGSECDNLRDLGADHLALGDTAEAIRYLEEVLALSRAIGNAWYETRACITLADALVRAGRLDEAARFSERGAEMAQRIGAKDLIAESLAARARVLESTSGTSAALAPLAEAADLARAAENPSLLWRVLAEKGRLLAAVGRRDEGAGAYAEARSVAGGIASALSDETLRTRFLASAESLLEPGPAEQGR